MSWCSGDAEENPLEENLFDLRVIKHWHRMGCDKSVIGVTQKLPGHSPEQSAVVDSALIRGIGLDGLQRFLPILNIIGLYGVFKNTSLC